jgi:hypothetical protein
VVARLLLETAVNKWIEKRTMHFIFFSFFVLNKWTINIFCLLLLLGIGASFSFLFHLHLVPFSQRFPFIYFVCVICCVCSCFIDWWVFVIVIQYWSSSSQIAYQPFFPLKTEKRHASLVVFCVLNSAVQTWFDLGASTSPFSSSDGIHLIILDRVHKEKKSCLNK